MKSVNEIVLENDFIRYVIDAEGWNKSFMDKTRGIEYNVGAWHTPFITVTKWGNVSPGGSVAHRPTSVAYSNGKITAKFETLSTKAKVDIAVDIKPHYITFELMNISDPGVDYVTIINLHLNISKHVGELLNIRWNDDFAVCVLALTLQTESEGGNLVARFHLRYGLVGAALALVATPASQICRVIEEVEVDQGLPHPTIDGKWAKISDLSKKSYLYSLDISETNVDEIISYTKQGGFATILIGDECWSECRGHYLPNTKNFPSGLGGIKEVVDKIHAAGLCAGLHIRTPIISPNDPYMTPVPDKRIVKSRWIPLATPIDEKTTFIPTTVPPTEFPEEVPGGKWAARYGVEIQIGDEIISYGGVSLTRPYGFTDCKRGALGTRAAPHSPVSEPLIYHLLRIFGDFVYDADSSILDEIADNIARVFNTCRFNMLYYDGSERLQGDAWYYKAKIQAAIYNRFESKNIFVQGSSSTNYTWHIMTSHVTSDGVRRERKRYIDYAMIPGIIGLANNLMTGYLGWYYFFKDTPLDDIEYLCQKSVGYDVPIVLWTHKSNLDKNPKTKEILALAKQYETLRLQGVFSLKEKTKVMQPGILYKLVKKNDEWKFIKPRKAY